MSISVSHVPRFTFFRGHEGGVFFFSGQPVYIYGNNVLGEVCNKQIKKMFTTKLVKNEQ